MTLRMDRLKLMSGMNIEQKKVLQILHMLEYTVLSKDDEKIEVEVPYFRTDVGVEDDLVSDVLRINDYTKIPTTPINLAPPVRITPEIYNFEDRLRDICVNLGFHEHITDPLVSKDGAVDDQILLENALTSEKNALRTSIRETLYPITSNYLRHKIKEAYLFEIGKVYLKKSESIESLEDVIELRALELVYRNDKLSPLESSTVVKSSVSAILQNVGIDYYYGIKQDNETKLYSKNTEIGSIKVDSATLLTESLLNITQQPKRVQTTISDVITDDLSLTVPLATKFGVVYNFIANYDENVRSLEVKEEIIDPKDPQKKHFLVQINHNIDDYTSFKEKLTGDLKDSFAVESRSI